MEELELEYKNYKIVFRIPEEIYSDKFLYEEAKKLFQDKHEWFEVVLFELLDEDGDGIPDKKFGKKFVVEFGKSINFKTGEKGEYPVPQDSLKIISKGKTKIGDKIFPNIIYIRE